MRKARHETEDILLTYLIFVKLPTHSSCLELCLQPSVTNSACAKIQLETFENKCHSNIGTKQNEQELHYYVDGA